MLTRLAATHRGAFSSYVFSRDPQGSDRKAEATHALPHLRRRRRIRHRRLGAALAEVLPDGTTVALCGTLGAGKTRLVQAIAEAAGVDRRNVLSPTFVLIQEYHGRRTVYHIDAYRLRDADEFLALGPEEYFEGDGLVLVEWADRVEPACRRIGSRSTSKSPARIAAIRDSRRRRPLCGGDRTIAANTRDEAIVQVPLPLGEG